MDEIAMTTSMLTSRGRTTIPRVVREHLGLVAGGRVEFEIRASGEVALRPVTRDIRTLDGILYRPAQCSVSLEEMEAPIARR